MKKIILITSFLVLISLITNAQNQIAGTNLTNCNGAKVVAENASIDPTYGFANGGNVIVTTGYGEKTIGAFSVKTGSSLNTSTEKLYINSTNIYLKSNGTFKFLTQLFGFKFLM